MTPRIMIVQVPRNGSWSLSIFEASLTFYSADDGNRFSMVSTSDTYPGPQAAFGSASFEGDPFSGPPRARYDSSPLLQLPAPLGRGPSPGSPVSNISQSRSSEDATPYMQGHDSSHQRLLPTSPGADQDYTPESYENHSSGPGHSHSSIESQMTRMGSGGVLRQSTISTQYPVETQNPYRHSQPQAAMGYEEPYAYTTEPEELSQGYVSHPSRNARGISLADNGPVPGPEGVRRVARPQARRASAQNSSTNANRYSRNSVSGGNASSTGPSLPPGAAPPAPYPYR